MPIIAHDGKLTIELARASYDYDRNRLVAVWRLTVQGVRQPTEVTTEVPVADMLAALPDEMAALYGWLATNAINRGDIPAGVIQP